MTNKARVCRYKQTLELIFGWLKVIPVKEYRFHPTRRWRVDYAFPSLKIAVEYEGMPFLVKKSRHTTIGGFTADAEKYNELALDGWLLLRFNAKHVQSGIAQEQIEKAFAVRPQLGVWFERAGEFLKERERVIDDASGISRFHLGVGMNQETATSVSMKKQLSIKNPKKKRLRKE